MLKIPSARERGLMYIHGSPLGFHGNVKSGNCVIDNRWVLKLTDFGIRGIRQAHDRSTAKTDALDRSKGLFWTAPEELRNKQMRLMGTKEGDIYAFGVILFEIIYRQPPFDTSVTCAYEIIEKLKNGEMVGNALVRPNVHNEATFDVPSGIVKRMESLMDSCWNELPRMRPDIKAVKASVQCMSKGSKRNVVESMATILEKYANNLENLVKLRTWNLMEEKKKTDALLYRMLPDNVVDRLKQGETVSPEHFDSATIYFSDIVDFTVLCSKSTPIGIVNLLNDLYTTFDGIVEHHDVYKVETIGDAYMVCSGIPVRNEARHVAEIANFSLDILASTQVFCIRDIPNLHLELRIGIHSGPCVAGVVGLTMPRYCLFGDTVNTASRMESSGLALKIHVSSESARELMALGGYNLTKRGEIVMKGKGLQKTYWLEGRIVNSTFLCS